MRRTEDLRFVTGLAKSGGFYKPTGFVEALAPLIADPAARVTALHLYTFNAVEATETWRQSMLEKVGGLIGRVGRLVRSCHERWDGGGYPDGLRGDQIPLGSRVISVCDAFHAMTEDRVYRKALSVEGAIAETPVYNVAVQVIGRDFYVFELEATAGRSEVEVDAPPA